MNKIPAAKKEDLARIYDKLYKFYGPQGWWPGDTRLEVIVGAILTQNTAWINVEKAIRRLKESEALSSPEKIRKMTKRDLARLIRPSGYYNVKALRLKKFMSFLARTYKDNLNRMSRQETARLRGELLGVNGVGKETCDSILLYAFRKPVFVVDAYTKRVFSRHGFIPEEAGYDEAQRLFMDSMPRDHRLYNEYHALIVRLGKELCRKKDPRCGGCPIRGVKLSKLPCN